MELEIGWTVYIIKEQANNQLLEIVVGKNKYREFGN